MGIAVGRRDRRNEFDVLVPTVKAIGYRCTKTSIDWQGEEVDVPDPKMVERAREIYRRHRQAAAIEDIERLIGTDFDVAEVKCFNKTDAILYKGNDYLVIWSRITSCGNTTAVIARRPKNGVLRVPDNLKGLVIGKGGSRIKELAAAWGLPYIKVN